MTDDGTLMDINDAQAHVWPATRPDRPMDSDGREHNPYTYEQLLADMDRADVTRAILVPPSIDRDRNDYVLEAARKYPTRFAIMGRVPLKTGAGRDLLKGWRQQPGMLGVRLTFHRDADRPWLTDGTADWFWPDAERHDIPVMVHAPERLAEIGAIAARYPRLKVIVDHMGFARSTIDDKTLLAAERMSVLARYPNVSVKVSALPAFSTAPYPFRNLREPLRRVIEAFGPQRCFWGADITRIPKSCSYRQVVTHFIEELDFLSTDDLTWIMGRGLAEFLRWPGAMSTTQENASTPVATFPPHRRGG
jgi:predicted TIM-barrel fold metal-dependent hydrolase